MAEYKSAYTGPQIDAAIAKANTATQPADLASKQDTLVSGTNIKTINNTSLLGSGNITIEGGGSDVSVKDIDYSSASDWDSQEDQPTQTVLQDILESSYDFIRIYNIPIDTGVTAEKIFVCNGMVDIDNSDNMRIYFSFDTGDEDEGTSPNIEQLTFLKPDGYDTLQMLTENYNLGEMNNVSLYSCTFDLSQGFPTLTQEDMDNIWTNKPDIINLTAGTTITIGYKSREDSDTAQVVYSTIVMESTTPTAYIITITYDEPNSQYVFDMEDCQIGGGGSATDVQINGTSITSNGVANILTETAYNSSSNKIATVSDLPDITTKQDTLVSGTNIKTINNVSILGSGNLSIAGGEGGLPTVSSSDHGKIICVDEDGEYEVQYVSDNNFSAAIPEQTTYTLTAASSNTGYIDSNGVRQNGANYRYTPKLSVVPNSNIVISKAPPVLGCWYDRNGHYIEGFTNGTSGGIIIDNYSVTVPSNAYFVIINGKTSDGSVTITYSTYVYGEAVVNHLRTKVSDEGKKELIVNDFFDKKYISFGDSITWFNDNGRTGYQTLMKNKLGLDSYTNEGVAGATISTISAQSSYTPIVTTVLGFNNLNDYDLITVFGGTNDFTLNSPMGTLGTLGDTNFNTATFYGAYRTIIEHILSLKPTARLILINPLQRNRQNSGENNWTTQNTEGHTLKDYADAVKNVAQLYSLPVVDLFYESGINTSTLSTFLADGLHPNDTGYVRIANCIMGKLVQCGK